MAYIPGLVITEIALATLSRGVAVTYGTNGVQAPAVSAKGIVGVLTEDVTSGNAAEIQVNGLANVKLGGTVTPGMYLAVTAAGLFVDASTNTPVAIARKAGVNGDVIEAMLIL